MILRIQSLLRGVLARLRIFHAGLVLLHVLAIPSTGESAQPAVRLGIISSRDEFTTLSDLLTVEFSAKSNLVVLERGKLEELYREQQLTANYVRLGEVLGTDGLLFLEQSKEGSNVFLQVRLVAVKQGVAIRHMRTLWPASDMSNMAGWIATYFERLLPKLSVSTDNAVPVSMVNIRSAVQSMEGQELARQLTVLMTEQLSREQQVFVLERQNMGDLSQEKDLKAADESAFWNGSYLIEGTIDRDAYSANSVTVSLRLVPPQGKTPLEIEITGPRTDVAGLGSKLSKSVMDALQVVSHSDAWHPKDEAEKYFTEASRAYKWLMLPEAQRASEAAWALGKQTPELAGLRLRAYGDAIGCRQETGNIIVPAVPQKDSLATAVRTLRLFCDGVSLFSDGTNRLNEEWFGIGLYKALGPATAILDGYYHSVELQQGNESQLEQLRALARHTLAILETNIPPGWEPNGGNTYPHRPDEAARRRWNEGGYYWQNGLTLSRYQWEQGGVWFEKPEDSLAMFGEVLLNGYHPESLPRIIGWSWTDRKRVPTLVRSFVTQMATHTNSAVRLEGLYLSVLRAPFDADRQDRRAVEELTAALWEKRDQVWSHPGLASIFSRTEEALRRKYYDMMVPVSEEPFASFKQRFRVDYLRHASLCNNQVFWHIFNSSFSSESPTAVEALFPEYNAFIQRLNIADTVLNGGIVRLNRAANTNRSWISTPPVNSHQIVLPAEKPLDVEFTPWKAAPSYVQGPVSGITAILGDDQKIWASLCTGSFYGRLESLGDVLFVVSDPITGEGEQIRLPHAVQSPVGSFVVNSNYLFAVIGERLHRYSRQKHAWEGAPMPVAVGTKLIQAGHRVCLSSSESLLEISPDPGKLITLVSSRRSPPVNELDPVWDGKALVYGLQERFCAQLGDKLHFYSLAKQSWENNMVLQPTKWNPDFGGWKQGLVSKEGLFLVRSSRRFEVFGFGKDGTKSELLLSQDLFPGLGSSNAPAARWEWPHGLDLSRASVLAEDNDLWFICLPDTRPVPFQSGDIFGDDRHVTLVYFSHELERPLCLPIRFFEEGKLVNCSKRFGWSRYTSSDKKPLWLPAGKGFVLSVRPIPGHWFLNKRELQRKFQEMAKGAKERANAPVSIETSSSTYPPVSQERKP